MDKTVRALEDLSATDLKLRDNAALTGASLRTLSQRRDELRGAIPQAFLAAYDDLGRRGRRPAVVAVRKSHCGGCYLRLPPQLDSAIRLRQSLRVCPHCRRLLYSAAPEQIEDSGQSQPEPVLIPLQSSPSKRTRRIHRMRPARERRPSVAKQKRRQA